MRANVLLLGEVSSCLLQALAGLAFPCLAGGQLCVRDTVIIE
jgi:hypothetical protein